MHIIADRAFGTEKNANYALSKAMEVTLAHPSSEHKYLHLLLSAHLPLTCWRAIYNPRKGLTMSAECIQVKKTKQLKKHYKVIVCL